MDLMEAKIKFFRLLSQAETSIETAKVELEKLWEDSQVRLRTDEIETVNDSLIKMAGFEKDLRSQLKGFFHITSEEVDKYLEDKQPKKVK